MAQWHHKHPAADLIAQCISQQSALDEAPFYNAQCSGYVERKAPQLDGGAGALQERCTLHLLGDRLEQVAKVVIDAEDYDWMEVSR